MDVLALILAQGLDIKWLFCARTVCRTWASICATIRGRPTVYASSVAALLASAPDDDPRVRTPEAAEQWCLSMGASLTDAGAVLVSSGRHVLIRYAIARPRPHDVASATMIPFESLTVAVVRCCKPAVVDAYLRAHPLAIIPERAVKVSPGANDDKNDKDKSSGRNRHQKVVSMLCKRRMLRFESVRGFVNAINWPEQTPSRTRAIHSIARAMGHDPKLARNALRAYGRRRQEQLSVDEALFLLARTGQLNTEHWAKQFEALIVEALGDVALDPRIVVDLLARSRPAMRVQPYKVPLLLRLYTESPLLAPLRPLQAIDIGTCPLLDPDARVDISVDIALLQLASSLPQTMVMAHAAVDTVVTRALMSAHQLMCSLHAPRDAAHDLWTVALRARSAYRAADASTQRIGPRPRHTSCAAGGACVVLAEARVRAREHGFMGEMWSDLFDLDSDESLKA
nr:hypothetical protein [Pandoravirus massiliensis]